MKERNVNNVLNILSDLVCIPSYGMINNNHPIIEYLKCKFKDCCEIIELNDKNGNTHLLVGVNCELNDIDSAIVLSGHMDTVKASNGHNCEMLLEGNKLKGLGISDMKAFIASIIDNLEFLKSMDTPVVVSLTSDEETNLFGITQIIQEMKKRNINADLTIVGEPTDLNYYVSNRGNSIYVSIMNGIACHSGTPDLGINAIELQSMFISEIMKIKQKYSSESAVCITHIDGGKSPSNVVPDMCSACFGIRVSNINVLNEIYNYLMLKHKEISKCYGESALFNVLFIPPFEKRENEFFNRYAEKNGKKMIDAKYATEAGYFQVAYPDADIAIYGPGCPEKIHSADEAILPDNVINYGLELKKMLCEYLIYKKQEGKCNVKKLVYKPE